MRQIITNVYKYDELSEKSRDVAWGNIVSNYLDKDASRLKRTEREKLTSKFYRSNIYIGYSTYPTTTECDVYGDFTICDLLDFVKSDISEFDYDFISCISSDRILIDTNICDDSCGWRYGRYKSIIKAFINNKVYLQWFDDVIEENQLSTSDVKTIIDRFADVLCKKMSDRCKSIEDLFKEFYRRKDDVALEICDKYLIEFYEDGTIFKGIKSENSNN